MGRMSRLLGAGCLGLAMVALVAQAAAGGEANPVRRAPAGEAAGHGRIIVKFRERAQTLSAATAGGARLGPKAAALMGKRLGVTLADGRAIGPRTQVLRSAVLDSRSLAKMVAADTDVEWAEVDHVRVPLAAPNDPLYPDGIVGTTPASGQWYLRAPAGTVKSSIDIETAWDVTHGTPAAAANAIVVADVDTGITSHPDLVNKILPGYDMVGSTDYGDDTTITANDGDLQDANPTDPGDWISATDVDRELCDSTDPSKTVQQDSSWHGTQTAGVLGAQTNNGLGMAGTGYDVMILPVRALGKCGGFDSDIAAAARWAAGLSVSGAPINAHPARVINMSLGGAPGTDGCGPLYPDLISELSARNVLIVAAAGNEEGLAVDVPAMCPGVVAVAGLRQVGTKVGFSNVGPEVTIAAPGGNCINTDVTQPCLFPILSTLNTGTTFPGQPTYSTSFGAVGVGTSFSTPIVSGTVALMLSANPALTNAQVISLLQGSATVFPPSDDPTIPACHAPNGSTQDECVCTSGICGAGMLNAGLAVQRAAGATGGAARIPAQGPLAISAVTVLDGGTSTPSGGASITGWAWSLVDGQSLAAIVGSSTGQTVQVQGLAAGNVTLRLVTTDSAGKTGIAFRSFPVAPAIPVAAISGIAGVAVGQTLLLSADNSQASGSGTIQSYQWTVINGAGTVALANDTSARATVTGLVTGTATVGLSVTDSSGQVAATTMDVPVSVAPADVGSILDQPSGGSSGSSSSGGGATSPAWLAGLLLVGALLAPRRRAMVSAVRCKALHK